MKMHKVDAWLVHYADGWVDRFYDQGLVAWSIQNRAVRRVFFDPQNRVCEFDRFDSKAQSCYMCEREAQA